MSPAAAITVGAGIAIVIAVWAFIRYAPGPTRQRARVQMACHAERDTKARLTLWNGRLRGGIGVITYERGSVQAHYEGGVYLIEWFGRQGHPIRHDSFETASVGDFNTRLTFWNSSAHLNASQTGGPGLSF